VERYLQSFQALLSGVSGLALLAALFVIGSAVATSVRARRREIGLLRCIGAERRHLLRLFLGEALVVGVAGTLVGVPLGLGLARLLLPTVRESAELVFAMRFFTAALDVSPATLALRAPAGGAAALPAGFAPARRGVRIARLAAVRSVERRQPRGAAVPGAVAAAVLVTLVGLVAEIRFDSSWGGNLAAFATDLGLVVLF